MKPAAFEYHAPHAIGEAVTLLESFGEEARPLAGGQSLVPLMSLRLARPSAIVDLNRIIELEYHRVEAEGLLVGALCRHRDIELDEDVLARCAAIADAVPLIGHVGIRNRGTVAGSIAHADPSAEWPCLALLLDAEIHVEGQAGRRRIPARDFFKGAFTTDLRPGELIVEVRFGWLPEGAGSAFVEVARRHGDFALGGAGAVLALAADGAVREARVAVAGVDIPSRAAAAEAELLGRAPDKQACRAAAAAAAAELRPTGDIHAPAAYRRRLGETLIRRALEQAAQRAATHDAR
jgi:aerobic carbon-monoxide dehydrogenase medium subunit